MRLSERSYPHPVVGNRDDVIGAAFQATVQMTADKDLVYLDVTIQNSSKTLEQLVEAGKATYAVHVECTNTLYRRAVRFSVKLTHLQIPADHLNEAVEVNVFAVAARDVSGYVVEGAHPDYTGAAFSVKAGDILAVTDGRVFVVETTVDALAKIGSIMQIDSAPGDDDVPMTLDFSGDKIRILLSKDDFKTYKLMRHDESISSVLTTAIVLPALVETLHYMMTDADDDPDNFPRWRRVLTRRLEDLGIRLEGECLATAQTLLELPVKRALLSSYNMAETSAS